MRTLSLAICLAVLVTGQPALAQDARYEPEDAKLMLACLNGVQTALSSDDESDASRPGPESCIGAASGICMEQPGNYSTVGMSDCMGRETAWWDERLNTAYRGLRDTLDAESFTALQTTQRAWIAFRDAECNFQYTYWREGTIRSTYYGSCMLDQTARRAIALEAVMDWPL